MYTDGVAALLGSVVDGLAYSETTDEGNVFVDRMPSDPDRAVCVYATPGTEADTRLPYDPVTLQVVVRSEADGRWAALTWQRIYSELHGKRYVMLPDGTFLAWLIGSQSSPFRLGDDEAGRPRYSSNYHGEIINRTAERPS